MITILVDHNIEGQAVLLLGTYDADGWSELFPIRLITFRDAGLSFDSSDREVWRFAQSNEMLLLTDNRNMNKKDSLELTIRHESNATSLPVLTISNTDRMTEREYRQRCATRLAEIINDLDNYKGAARLFIP